MADGNSLINLGDISKPATLLIEKISEGVGWLAKPVQVKRMAAAEAEAQRIKALAQIEISEIEHRALVRTIQVEGKKQKNIEQITYDALKDLNENASPEKIENDWLSSFFEKCQIVSNVEMQSIWSRILAGEANAPGSFSKRTLDLVATLDKSEADAFSQLCNFSWKIAKFHYPLICNLTDEIYSKNKINFGILNHLESIGLISFNQITTFTRKNLQDGVIIDYFGRDLKLNLKPTAAGEITVGQVLLTVAGVQLAPICGAKPIEGFYEYSEKYFRKEGYLDS